jgi:pilus assembly protein Flp/PilA
MRTKKCGSNQKNWESVVMKTFITRFAKDESGVTAIEYGLIAAIVGVGIITGLTTLKGGLNTLFATVNTSLTK